MPDWQRILNWFLSIALAAMVAVLASSHGFYLSSIVSPYFAAALAGAAIVFACIRPGLEFLQVLAITIALWLLELMVAGTRASGIFLVVPTISLVGLAAFLMLGLRSIWARGEEQKLLLCAFIPAMMFAVSDWFASNLLALTEKLHPRVYDFFLYSYDASLIWQPGPSLGKLFVLHTWFRLTSTIVYVGLAIPIALVYGLNLRKRGRRALPVMYAFLLTGPIGVVLYNLLPAMGPAHVFRGAFPFFMPTYQQAAQLVPTLVAVPGPRNAIPSLHMGWVLLAWWNSRGLNPLARLVVMFFVVFTVFSTLGTGEHYLVDLILAFPFALLLQGLCKTEVAVSDQRRWLPTIAALATILIWFALLKYDYHLFWISPSIPWLFALFTVAGSIVLHHWMRMVPDDASAGQHANPAVVAE